MTNNIEPNSENLENNKYLLRLFVAGDEHNSAMAIKTLKDICTNYLENRCEIEVIDVLQDYSKAMEEKIVVAPALIIKKPLPRTVIFGNLSDRKKVMKALQIHDQQ